jgi:phosphatidylserine/phosphatidylglycerophosphate/cardiolipin synthase-like enzyme
MWIIDGETDHAVAVVGGLNIANEYFRIDPQNPTHYWRDQDVIVEGDVIKDMVATFERNFEYFLEVKESRGIFNTNIYWQEICRQESVKFRDNLEHILNFTGF